MIHKSQRGANHFRDERLQHCNNARTSKGVSAIQNTARAQEYLMSGNNDV